jgi:Arc/MetJ-type ribon-helix-helix transcriptional regulator
MGYDEPEILSSQLPAICLMSDKEWKVVNHPINIYIPSMWMENAMADNVYKLRDKAGESEKITVNLGYVDLGRIDLLVQEGFYSNRTDFIRTAIRNQLTVEGEAVKQSIIRHTLELGLRDYSRADLEAVRAAGERLHIRVLGLARIGSDVPPELALATIESITVLGALQASTELKSALAERIR